MLSSTCGQLASYPLSLVRTKLQANGTYVVNSQFFFGIATIRHDSLLQKVIEGRFQGKKTPGRPRTMLLDACDLMLEDEESAIDYAKLKEKAHDRETWRQ